MEAQIKDLAPPVLSVESSEKKKSSTKMGRPSHEEEAHDFNIFVSKDTAPKAKESLQKSSSLASMLLNLQNSHSTKSAIQATPKEMILDSSLSSIHSDRIQTPIHPN